MGRFYFRLITQLVECIPYTDEVAGSSPTEPTKFRKHGLKSHNEFHMINEEFRLE